MVPRLPVLFCASLALLTSCAATPEAQDARADDVTASAAEVVLSLREITCKSCGKESIAGLKGRPGVIDASFDASKAELTVRYDEGVTSPATLAELVRATGNDCEIGAGKGSYAKQVAYPKGADVVWISKAGEAVDVERHLVPGKVTVIDFYADWCGPCREVDRTLLSFIEVRDDVAVRKVNVVDWESAVAKAHLKGVAQIPYVLVYDKNGQRTEAIVGLDVARLERAIERAAGPGAPKS